MARPDVWRSITKHFDTQFRMHKSIRTIAIISISGLILGLTLSGCNINTNTAQTNSSSDAATLHVVTSIPPLYSITANVVDGISGVELKNILPPGASPHTYSLTPADAQTLDAADAFVETGVGIEEFLSDAMTENTTITNIDLSTDLDLLVSQDPDEPGDDPHIWVSIRNAIVMTQAIADELTRLDPANAIQYQINADNYINTLQQLDDYAVTQFTSTTRKQFIPLHPSFAYFAEDYNLEQIASIEVIPGHEPSAQKMAELLTIIKDNDVKALLSEPQLDDRILNSIAKDSGLPIYQVDPVGIDDLSKTLYEDTMKSNVDTFVKALQ